MLHQHIVGISVAVARNDKMVYARGYGYRARGPWSKSDLPATPHTVYNIASMTKQFTAACIMLLQQDGKLSVDDPLSKYFPSLPGAGVVTLRHLLNHTSGLADYLDLIDVNSLSMPKIIAALEKTKLRYEPGTRFEYSNSNYVLLGAVVSKVSGEPFDTFLTTRIIRPLGLQFTSIGTTPVDMKNGALGYTVPRCQEVRSENSSVVRLGCQVLQVPPQTVSILDFPDGGVNSTVLDLVKWDQALDAGRVVNKKLLAMMMSPGPHGPEITYGYGFGLRTFDDWGHREISHTGGWTGYTGKNATFPDDRVQIVLLSNTDTLNKVYVVQKIFAVLYPPSSQDAWYASAPGQNPALTHTARVLLTQLALKKLDPKLLSPEYRRTLTGDNLRQLTQQFDTFGALQHMVFVERDADTSGVYEIYRLFYPQAVVSYSVRFDAEGRAQEIDVSRED